MDRRIFLYASYLPERRSGIDRRIGLDRRSGIERRDVKRSRRDRRKYFMV